MSIRHSWACRCSAWTADELVTADFPEPKWAIAGIIAEGVSLLAEPPKVGKSWHSLGLGPPMAADGRAFDFVPVNGGQVLYWALEDAQRRLQSRRGLGSRSRLSVRHCDAVCPA
ncbi:AAA family ATPase [Streptomyces harbinensis]|nr:AAA family ATPase [Streptomyces harbinensis]